MQKVNFHNHPSKAMQQSFFLLCDYLPEDNTEAKRSSKKSCLLGICCVRRKSTAFIQGCLQKPLDVLPNAVFYKKKKNSLTHVSKLPQVGI